MRKLIQHSLIILAVILAIGIQVKAEFAEGLYQANLFFVNSASTVSSPECSALDSTQVNFYLGKDTRANSYKAYPLLGDGTVVRAKINNNKLVVAYNNSLAPYVEGRMKISAKIINSNEPTFKAVVKSGNCKFNYIGQGILVGK